MYTLAGQKLCFLSRPTANPFPLESFCQHDSGQFPPRKSSLVYKFQNGVIIDRATPATQNAHDKSIRNRPSHDANLQQAQTFFPLKYIYIYVNASE